MLLFNFISIVSILLIVLILTIAVELISVTDTANFYYENPSCNMTMNDKSLPLTCLTKACGRKVVDGLFTFKEIEKLHSIVNKGMSHRPALGGPTILDINAGILTEIYLLC